MTVAGGRFVRLAGVSAVSLALASCVGPARTPVASQAAPPPVPAPAPNATPATPPAVPAIRTAVQAGVSPGPAIEQLPIDPVRAGTALAAFRTSCAALLKRQDGSGLTQPGDWQPACAAVATTPPGQAIDFFRRYFETARVGEGRLYATGYYEPEIEGSQAPMLGYDVPIYGIPNDLVEADLGQFAPDLKGRKIRGRVQGGKFVPYPDRTQIEGGAIQGQAPVIGYAKDKIAFFFLQIQGSGRVRQPDGRILRIGYASQNGQPYTGIGKAMIAQGLIQPGQGSMQGIVGWLRAHPDQADAVMRQNRSFVFFRPLDGPPLGALGVPVTERMSVAADPAFTPLGAPVWLSPDRAEAAGLWIAQDTGGAIKGANRFDTFWGAGAEAERIAGGMSTRGLSYLLVPRGTVERLRATQNAGQDARS